MQTEIAASRKVVTDVSPIRNVYAAINGIFEQVDIFWSCSIFELKGLCSKLLWKTTKMLDEVHLTKKARLRIEDVANLRNHKLGLK